MAEKFEPLKGKIYYLDTRYPMSIDKVPKFVSTEIEIFFRDDLKSAVQGLLQEIEKKKENILAYALTDSFEKKT